MTPPQPPAWLLHGETVHVRMTPFRRRFRYRLVQLLVDVDRIGEAAARSALFAYNRPGVFSFYDRDHGDRSGAPLRGWAEAAFASAGVRLDGGAITLACFPRLFGYVFNPISLFFGHGPDGVPRGVIYEVNNTFGHSHAYVAPISGSSMQAHAAPKRLHVSPFFDVAGAYRFEVAAPGERLALTVQNHVDGALQHVATLTGQRRAFSDRGLLAALLGYPLSTLGVTAGIHWEALQLWLRGARYRRTPQPPHEPFSSALGNSNSTTVFTSGDEQSHV